MGIESSIAAAPSTTPRQTLEHRHVHFVGIGGCGMSGLARLARAYGAICSGSDQRHSPVVEALRQEQVPVDLSQSAPALPESSELVVISAAISQDHPQVIEARRRGVAVVKYAQLLGRLMSQTLGVAVAGTHGKSTTTSMLCHLLIRCGLDPSFIVGANCPQIGGGWRCATGTSGQPVAEDPGQDTKDLVADILVAEACEYDRSFHHLTPTHGLILNVEADHLDMYADLGQIVESFATFARCIRPAGEGGSLLINHEMGSRMEITTGLGCAIQTIGFSPQADWQVTTQTAEDHAKTDPSPQVRLTHQGTQVARWASPLPGEHMAYNAAAAAVTANRLGAPWSHIVAALEGFAGLDRRMQYVGQLTPRLEGNAQGDDYREGIRVMDDYGHHPTEIESTLRAIRTHFKPRRLICIFQPHQHSRTRFLLDQFAVSFTNADLVLVPEIYFVRDSEHERQAVTAQDLVRRLRGQGVAAEHAHPFASIVQTLRERGQDGDLILTMGAGDVWKIAWELVGAKPR